MFLICLDPLLNNRLRGSNYTEHTNEEVCSLLDDYYLDQRLVSALHVLQKKIGGIICSKFASQVTILSRRPILKYETFTERIVILMARWHVFVYSFVVLLFRIISVIVYRFY